MSAEAAFLEALKATPADDTARLVYADWLDEHGRAQEAEYMRLTTALAHAEQDYATDQPAVRRLLTIAEQLPSEWRNLAGSRFKVVFYACVAPAKQVATIKAIRTHTGLGLAEVKDAVMYPPSELLLSVPFERALQACDQIREAGGTIHVHPSDRIDLPTMIRYDIVATRWCHASGKESQALHESIKAFAEFLRVALSISAEEAATLATNKRKVMLAESQNPVTAKARVRELQKLLPWQPGWLDDEESQPAWGVWVDLSAPSVCPKQS
jgi:uncharacterized protein (TIGR02996 family)